MQDKQLIIGLGSGRCGTHSLCNLLNSQTDSNITHEMLPVLYWDFLDSDADRRIAQLAERKEKVVGDVAFYYLNYVEYIAEKFPQTKFVCMKRQKEQTVRSFIKKVGKRNHWSIDHGQPDGKWDPTFPNINAPTLRECIEQYWELYYKKAEELSKLDNFAIFSIDRLNSEEGVRNILEFCEIEKPIIETGIKSNAGVPVLGK